MINSLVQTRAKLLVPELQYGSVQSEVRFAAFQAEHSKMWIRSEKVTECLVIFVLINIL